MRQCVVQLETEGDKRDGERRERQRDRGRGREGGRDEESNMTSEQDRKLI